MPVNALLFRAEGLRAVVVDANHKTHLRQLTIGRDFGTTLEVLQGLEPDDWIVLNPADSLDEGQDVRVKEIAQAAGPAQPDASGAPALGATAQSSNSERSARSEAVMSRAEILLIFAGCLRPRFTSLRMHGWTQVPASDRADYGEVGCFGTLAAKRAKGCRSQRRVVERFSGRRAEMVWRKTPSQRTRRCKQRLEIIIRRAPQPPFRSPQISPLSVSRRAPIGSGFPATGRRTAQWAQLQPVTQNTFTLPFTVGYEVDLFGQRRRTIEAAEASYQASAANLENVRLVITAELAGDYFTLRQLDTELGILNRTVDTLQRGLQLVDSRHKGGVASGLDVAQEETLLQTTRTQATLLLQQRKQFEDAIAVLVGKPAPDFHIPSKELNAEPPPMDLGLPSDLLERRPDIAQAERQMAVANAQIGIAKAAYYPSLNLFGNGGWQSADILPSWRVQRARFGLWVLTWLKPFSPAGRGAPRWNSRNPDTTSTWRITASPC